MTYLDAIELRLTPFPLDGHAHVKELSQVYFFVKDNDELALNDYMLFVFKNQM